MENAIPLLSASSQLLLAATLAASGFGTDTGHRASGPPHSGHAVAALLSLGVGVAALALAVLT